ncbi:MAG: MFS transporter [Anaerolineales bacterium]|nr:MFS transporter [Anaerolineales bacterium]MCS7246748.1 MFS transporter [Anaerolineales bacterium]MDW8160558.1 MFS transporter [Anaerolineales bacterium]MDW8448217.1 MFS transporter [Anaerolineales bacterium]
MGRDFTLLTLSLILWGIGEGLFFSFVPLYLQELGAKAVQIGGTLGGLSFAAMLCHLPAGYLADRLGRRTIIVASYVIGLIATVSMFLAPSLPFFATSLFLYGATAFVLAPMHSYITHVVPKEFLARALTLISASYSFGYMFGPLIGGLLAERFGLRHLFLFASCLFLISTLLVFLLRPQPVTPSPQGPALFRSLLGARFLAFTLIMGFTIFAAYLSQPLTPNYLQNQRSLSLSTIGFLFFVNSSGIVIFNLVMGSLSPLTGILLAQLLTITFSILLLKSHSVTLFSLAFFILGSYRAAQAVSIAQLRNYTRPESMGLAYGFAESIFALAMILASLFGGFLYAKQPTAMYSISIILTLLAMGLMAAFSLTETSSLFSSRSSVKLSGNDRTDSPCSEEEPSYSESANPTD